MTRFILTVIAAAAIFTSACNKDKNESGDESVRYKISTEASAVTWKGYLRNGHFNEGTIAVTSESLSVKNGIVTGGTFKMPLATLKNINLPTEEAKAMLITHLQSADFFDMALYPELTFSIGKVEPYAGKETPATPGANYRVSGHFGMLGKTREISFPALIAVEGNHLTVKADLKLDRTEWGMTYATADTLADNHYIRPLVDIHLDISGATDEK